MSLWRRLLACLALHDWAGRADCRRRAEREASERIDSAIVNLFTTDERADVTAAKAVVLHEELTDAECRIQNAAAALLGMRCDARGVEILTDAVRTLSEIGAPQAAVGLAEALGDLDYGVRWAAAEGLAQIGQKAIPKILEYLSRHTLSDAMHEAAYHALHQTRPPAVQIRLQSLLNALRGPGAAIEAPTTAYRLLQTWEQECQLYFDGETLKLTVMGTGRGCPLTTEALLDWVEESVKRFFPGVRRVTAI